MGVKDGLPVHELIGTLALRRPIFHSEADFQHELAWELKMCEQSFAVRLEVPSIYPGVGTTDLVVRTRGGIYGIELKYLTRKQAHEFEGEQFSLKAQGATDLRRYGVLKDIQRMEAFNRFHGGPSYVVVLTNDPAYWNKSAKPTSIDAEFRIEHGRRVGGLMTWAAHAAAGSIKGREAPLELVNRYTLDWRDYPATSPLQIGFRYLCVKVDGRGMS